MQIFIKTHEDKTIVITLDETHTIEILKCVIEDREGIPPEQQKLIYAGKQIDKLESKTMSSLGIQADSTIFLLLRLPGGVFQLQTRTLVGRMIALLDNKTDSVSQLKAQIEEREAIPPHQQRLDYSAKLMEEDQKRLDGFWIAKDAAIHPLLRLKEGVMQAFVRSLLRKTATIDVNPSDTVTELKDKEGIPLEEQRLIFSDMQLHKYDLMTLPKCNVKDEATIDLMFRLIGGVFDVFAKLMDVRENTLNETDKMSLFKDNIEINEIMLTYQKRLTF